MEPLKGPSSPDRIPLVEARNVSKVYMVRKGFLSVSKRPLRAVRSVNLSVFPGETFGLVGESGCGKSTLGRVILYLDPPTEGNVLFQGEDLSALSGRELRGLRRHMQMIFQDPYSSLNPRKSIGWLIGEPLVIHKEGTRSQIRDQVAFLMEEVGLRPETMNHHPHQFSGGQRQRVSVARALALNPDFIVADEPVSALDVSIQAQILQLLKSLQNKYNLTYLVISHDLAVIHHISDRIGVMYLGEFVDVAPRDRFLSPPTHPYTEALLAAAPRSDPRYRRRRRIATKGDVPSPLDPPSGCTFHTRCPYAESACTTTPPPLEHKGQGRFISCHFR